MSLSSTIAFIKLLITLQRIIEAALKNIVEKQNEADAIEIQKAVLEYGKGASIEEKTKSAEQIRDMFRNR